MGAALAVDRPGQGVTWLRSRRWDLTWISLSVILVAMPYAVYMLINALQSVLQPVASNFGTTVDDLSRNAVNAMVALFVGGPHMYATFTRTALDRGFSSRHKRLLLSSLVIPVIVVAGALLNLTLLLTVFFFWASIHVLHQIIYIVELYNQRRTGSFTLVSRLADYGVVLTALYPLAAWKIVNGKFAIGSNDIGKLVATYIPVGPWMVWLAGGAFGLALLVWIAKSIVDARRGTLHVPKTVFIGLTVTASFFVPALGNLDTAFQGMNVWHSLQYLALTWMLNSVRQQRGELSGSPFVNRLSGTGSGRRYYLFNIALTVADVALAGAIFLALRSLLQMPFNAAFDRAYYIAVLSFLWIHYYLDHYLFTQPRVIAA